MTTGYDSKKPRGKRGLGSIYQRRSDGRWVGSVSVTIDGYRVKKTVSHKDRPEVVRKLQALKLDYPKQAGFLRDRSMTVGRYLDSWLRRRKPEWAPTTYTVREQHVRSYVKPAIGAKRLDRLHPADVEEVLARILDGGRSLRTASGCKATMSVAFRDAMAERPPLLSSNPAAAAKMPSRRKRENTASTKVKHLDAEQAQRLLSVTEGDALHPVWTTLLYSGIRYGEMAGLSWEDVDTRKGMLHVRKGWALGDRGRYVLRGVKTRNAIRDVPMHESVVASLTALREACPDAPPSDPVFTDAAGQRLDFHALNKALTRACTLAGIPRVTPHALRHTCASLILATGGTIVEVQSILGHASAATTMKTYLHTDDRGRRKAIEGLGDLLRTT